MNANFKSLALAALALALPTVACTYHPIVPVDYDSWEDPIEDTDGEGETEGEQPEDPEQPDWEPPAEPVCGDGVHQPEAGEECDDGEANADNADCTEGCTINVCGDGLVLEGAEQCDDGDLNGTPDSSCSEDCELPS